MKVGVTITNREIIDQLGGTKIDGVVIDYEKLADDAKATIKKFGSYEEFVA